MGTKREANRQKKAVKNPAPALINAISLTLLTNQGCTRNSQSP